VVTVLDRNGVVLAQHPGYTASIGKKGPNPRVLEVITGAPRGVFDDIDARGTARLFAFESVDENPDGSVPLRVVVSLPLRPIYAELNASFLTSIAGLALATLLLLLGAWYGSEHFVLRDLRKLLDVARRVRAGDLAARTGLVAGREEISQLGNAFDDMAQSLQDREARLQQALREARELAITDPLTGLYNRRYLWELLRRELLKGRRGATPVAALLVDLDHFKRFNDTWGHDAGDLVLKAAAKVLREAVRDSDIACRYGGEELAVVLPGAPLEIAIERAEAMRRGVAALRLDYDGKPLDAITASFGVAVFPRHAEDAETLLRAADSALYRAKREGRNRVRIAQSADAPVATA
jgi:diguanylate cyclase (GGDEF)-like protein